MHNEEQLCREFEKLVGRHRKLIRFLCQGASYGQEIYYKDLMQECYVMLLKKMSELEPGTSELKERAWVFWRCRDAITRYRYQLKRVPGFYIEEMLADTREAPDEVTQLTIDDLAACLAGTERRCFLLMAAGTPEQEIERELGLKHSSFLRMRHLIKKKIQKYMENENDDREH